MQSFKLSQYFLISPSFQLFPLSPITHFLSLKLFPNFPLTTTNPYFSPSLQLTPHFPLFPTTYCSLTLPIPTFPPHSRFPPLSHYFLIFPSLKQLLPHIPLTQHFPLSPTISSFPPHFYYSLISPSLKLIPISPSLQLTPHFPLSTTTHCPLTLNIPSFPLHNKSLIFPYSLTSPSLHNYPLHSNYSLISPSLQQFHHFPLTLTIISFPPHFNYSLISSSLNISPLSYYSLFFASLKPLFPHFPLTQHFPLSNYSLISP